MLSAINSNQSFGSKCLVLLPACTTEEKVFEKVSKINPNFKLRFVKPENLKNVRKLAEGEFTYNGKKRVKGTRMAKFIFNDTQPFDFQLSAFLKSVFGEARVASVRKVK